MAAVQEQARTVQATAKFVRCSPRKARLVTDNIRGRSVPEARTILAFTERAAAIEVEKVLSSAVANAESNPALHWNGDDLVIHAVYVDEGPTLKRWRARARGRVARIKKRTCHITIHVAQSAQAAPAEEAEADQDAAPQEDRGDGELMGQKIHPGGLRVGVIHDWKSNWMVGKKEFAGALIEDIKIREHILKKLSHAGLSDILIRKDKQRITIDIYTARPGIVIGKSGVEVDALRKEVHAMTQKNVHININEIKRPELDAKLVAQSIAEQLQNRVSFRRAMKRSLASAIRSGAAGVKVQCSGRLGGSEMSRSEQYSEGRVPLHTIRADIDYGFVEAKTPTGRIGVKVWINKGEIMPEGYGGAAAQGDAPRRPGHGAPPRRRHRRPRRFARVRPQPQPGSRGPRPGAPRPARPARRRRTARRRGAGNRPGAPRPRRPRDRRPRARGARSQRGAEPAGDAAQPTTRRSAEAASSP